MRFALRLARRRGLEREAADRLERVLSRLRLPPLPAVEPGPLLEAMRRDKKARESGLVWVLPSALGRGEMVSDVTWSEVEMELRGFLDAGS
jgi:3-dehydroquinate synthetase